MHGNFTFVCLLQEAVEQCGCVLEIWQLTVVFDQPVCEERLVPYILATSLLFIQANNNPFTLGIRTVPEPFYCLV